MRGTYIVTLVADGELEPWEADRVELVSENTLRAAGDLIYDRLAAELGRTIEVRIVPDRRRATHPVRHDRRRLASV